MHSWYQMSSATTGSDSLDPIVSKNADTDEPNPELAKAAKKLSALRLEQPIREHRVLLCDAGYGYPSEKRPRKEKIRAIARQLNNFLEFQALSSENTVRHCAQIKVVGCDERDLNDIRERLQDIYVEDQLPCHLQFSSDTLTNDEASPAVYLSPDADDAIDFAQEPPVAVIVGMLIDRRIQPNRSKTRAQQLGLQTIRLPIQDFHIDNNEPMNIDTVMEIVQMFWWNYDASGDCKEAYMNATSKAIQRHAARHPNRPFHKPRCESSSMNDHAS